MNELEFCKYQGAGNDFVVIDEREQQQIEAQDQSLVARLCDRKFGIGADGLMLLRKHDEYDFEMLYFNADGRPGSLCGNGGRCIVAFAQYLGLIDISCTFLAADGPHRARITGPDWIELSMHDVEQVEEGVDHYFLDTGSPHYVSFVEELDVVNVVEAGRAVRYSDRFRENGTNVNFVERHDHGLEIATYERGVEDETLACGTGVTAAAIAHLRASGQEGNFHIPVRAKGGPLAVRLRVEHGKFQDIWLCGPARMVFKGTIAMDKLAGDYTPA